MPEIETMKVKSIFYTLPPTGPLIPKDKMAELKAYSQTIPQHESMLFNLFVDDALFNYYIGQHAHPPYALPETHHWDWFLLEVICLYTLTGKTIFEHLKERQGTELAETMLETCKLLAKEPELFEGAVTVHASDTRGNPVTLVKLNLANRSVTVEKADIVNAVVKETPEDNGPTLH